MIEYIIFWNQKTNMELELKDYAIKHKSFSEFWGLCERSDWMIWLLQELEYRNAEKLWEVFQNLREQSKQSLSKEELEEWRKEFLTFLENLKQSFKVEAKDSNAATRKEREKFLSATWIYLNMALGDNLLDAITSAKFDAGVTARLAGKSEEDIEVIREQAKQETNNKLLKQQADLLRKIIPNPFNPLTQDSLKEK